MIKLVSWSLLFLFPGISSRSSDRCNSLPWGYWVGRKLKSYEGKILLSLFMKGLKPQKRECRAPWGGGWLFCEGRKRKKKQMAPAWEGVEVGGSWDQGLGFGGPLGGSMSRGGSPGPAPRESLTLDTWASCLGKDSGATWGA